MEENKNTQEEKEGCKMPRDLRIGIAMVLTLLKDTPCINGVADFKVGDECDNN